MQYLIKFVHLWVIPSKAEYCPQSIRDQIVQTFSVHRTIVYIFRLNNTIQYFAYVLVRRTTTCIFLNK